MDFVRGPLGIVIDHTRPFIEVDISGGDATPNPSKKPRTDQPSEIPFKEVNVSGGSQPPIDPNWHGGRPVSAVLHRPIPQTTYTLLDIPISTTKAIRVGCWASKPIDSDALKGQIFPNFRQTLEAEADRKLPPSKLPEVIVPSIIPKVDSSLGERRVVHIGENTSVLYRSDVKEHILKLVEREKKLGRLSSAPSQHQECPCPPGVYYCDDRPSIVAALKVQLKYHEIAFKSQYSYVTMGYKHCIMAKNTCGWKEDSTGIMWAGACGINDICVVTLSGHVDWKRVYGGLASADPKTVLSSFRKCVLSELEDLGDPPCTLSGKLDRSFDPPFCIVSETSTVPGGRLKTKAVPGGSGHETSSSAHNVPGAVSLVQGSGLLEQAKDSGGVIKLAISAFGRFMGKKFEAEEIEVTVLFGRKFGSGYIRDLDKFEIGDYLAAVEPIMV